VPTRSISARPRSGVEDSRWRSRLILVVQDLREISTCASSRLASPPGFELDDRRGPLRRCRGERRCEQIQSVTDTVPRRSVRRRYSASRRYSAHWGSDREPSDSFESVRFDSRSPNFLREVRRTYYIVCVDNVTFDPDYDAIQKRPFGIFKKETTWELPKRSRRDHRLRRPNKRSNKVATPHSMRPAAQPLLVGAD
jgi:hypothetical protein